MRAIHHDTHAVTAIKPRSQRVKTEAQIPDTPERVVVKTTLGPTGELEAVQVLTGGIMDRQALKTHGL